ncbi:MAG: tRNA (adenosine(37)-N6)-threonylcarbamoyltransferase complex transferase subunit TsaD [Candidatus Omnitrophica bacterium]|nr:tRNA (adenosine(37)-N6)-threonylcarbamoyltransferase complex transferase subunit TsaD [Candidatus Omnitrophota bacterium]MBU1091144.1 tRNA (adenosine(37)-N6)-threonylcarbamoyltransferase complex transferase subunit TsaD [Candidatus Omnitrophota bacterium]
MNVLGIETSCDETSVSVVRNGKNVLSNKVASSVEFHSKYGGVIPEIASRMQLETIVRVAQLALKKAKLSLSDINLVSVTDSPGLLGSLLIGIGFARSISEALGVPVLGVDHVLSHIYANFLDCQGVKFPFIALVASGGHTSLFYLKGFDRITILGETQDDACGEAFDKVAKILGLGYPGGPLIEKLAKKGGRRKIIFRCSNTEQPLNFSFSGIKTAVLYYLKKNRLANRADIAYSFQETVIETLIKKSFRACDLKRVERLVFGGGVVVNNRLRERFFEASKQKGIKCYFPSRGLCMDNAAMVAGLGYRLFKKRGEYAYR